MEKKISYTVQDTDLPCTVEFLLKDRMALTRAQIRSAKFRHEGICMNGVQIRVTEKAMPGAVLEVLLESDAETEEHLEAQEGFLDIRYEDADLIIVNKAAGVAVHPGHGHYSDTLANHLTWYYRQRGLQVTIRAVGRLDRDTSGLVVFAKNKVAAARLSARTADVRECGVADGRQYRAVGGRQVKKEYVALVWGHLKEKRGCIELPIRKCPNELNKMEISQEGSFARTHYQVMEEYEKLSLVRLWLDTGRTHQIRVHMASLGHPLVGDPIYGMAIEESMDSFEKEEEHGPYGISRAALHCERVEVIQPFTGERIIREAAMPEDMQRYKKER